MRKYFAFDIETAKEVPGVDFDWKPHRPLGICCIASQASDSKEPRAWHGQTSFGTPAPQMSRAEIARFLETMANALHDGYTPLSWNGLSFDFDILAEESALVDDCKRLAMGHVDMMFHVVCEKGFPVSLKSAASGLRLPGKLEGVEGINVPLLWAAGQYATVIEYVSQDVRTTLAVAQESEKRKSFAWTTRKGTTSQMPLSNGWMPVDQAARLPLPDTSWMSDPPSRKRFMEWMN